MKKEELATLLTGLEEIPVSLQQSAEDFGLVIVYGASDDLLEFLGGINDEVAAYEGTTAVITNGKDGNLIVVNADAIAEINGALDDYNLPPLKIPTVTVKSEWDPKTIPSASWLVSTDLPHASFDLFEDGQVFCRGLVLDVVEIKAALSPSRQSGL